MDFGERWGTEVVLLHGGTVPSVSTLVIALGGNALHTPGTAGTAEEQASQAGRMAHAIAELVRSGHHIVITHGNGPQVGSLAVQQLAGAPDTPPLPLHLLVAMTQGSIASLLISSLREHLPELRDRIAAVVTHVAVAEPPVPEPPTKPIGPFLDGTGVEAALALGWHVADDAGRGRRRMVPSPRPIGILEALVLSTLVDAGFLVVAGGGGGIPVTADGRRIVGVDGVVDKDRTAVLIARAVDADALLLVTGVERVRLGYGTPDERPVDSITTVEAARYLAAGEFPAGSMGPKIEAAIDFVDGGGGCAIITSAEHLGMAMTAGAGSRIVRGDAA